MKDVVNKLEALRRPGESKKDFALRLGISPVQLSRYYSGVVPGRKVLTRIAERTGASLDWFLQGPAAAPGEDLRRLGAKTDRSLSDQDRVGLACSYLDEIKGLAHADREALKELIRELAKNPRYLERVIMYLGFLKFETRFKDKKGRLREQ